MANMNLGGTIRINRTGFFIIGVVCLFYILFYYLSSDDVSKTAAEQQNAVYDMNKLLLAAIAATKLGGEAIIRSESQVDGDVQFKLKGKTKEGADDRVTIADFMSHCVMYNGIKNSFPRIKIVSEEDTHCNKEQIETTLELDDSVLNSDGKPLSSQYIDASKVTVWIDPLDATQEYTEKMYEYVTTMACIAINGEPKIGVVHNVFTKETSWAWVGRIASPDLQMKPVKADKVDPKIVISRSHAGEAKMFLKKAFGDNVDIVTAAGAGYKSLLVAHHNVTSYIHTTSIKKWDLCAGNAIINYIAGGQFTKFDNSVIDYSSGQKAVHDKGFVATLRDHDMYIQKINAAFKAEHN